MASYVEFNPAKGGIKQAFTTIKGAMMLTKNLSINYFFVPILFYMIVTSHTCTTIPIQSQKSYVEEKASPKPDSLIISGDSAYYPSFLSSIKPGSNSIGSAASSEAESIPAQKQPEPLKIVTPNWSEEIRKTVKEGTVWIKIKIETDGKISIAHIQKSTNKLLNEVSLIAAMQCRFSPAMMNGKPISVWAMLPFRLK